MDMLHNPNSSIVDAQLTKVLDGNLLNRAGPRMILNFLAEKVLDLPRSY